MAEKSSAVGINVVGFLATLVGVGVVLVTLFYSYDETTLILGLAVAIVGLLLQRLTSEGLEKQRRRGS